MAAGAVFNYTIPELMYDNRKKILRQSWGKS